MADIFHYFPINAPADKVFECISTPTGLDKWWTESSEGKSAIGQEFQLHFTAKYHWSAVISKFRPDTELEFTMTKADEDWIGSKVGFRLTPKANHTDVQFYHTGWKTDNEHYRISNFCWAMYLRILKRHLEFGEFVPYEDRLDA